MSFDDSTIEFGGEVEESLAEYAVYQQTALDILFAHANEYMVSDERMRQLCELASINFDDLQKYLGKPVTCKTDNF